MVSMTRRVERLLGDGIKKREANEEETVIVQRRSLCTKRSILKGEIIKNSDLESLRPAPIDSFNPQEIEKIINKKASKNLEKGKVILEGDFSWKGT